MVNRPALSATLALLLGLAALGCDKPADRIVGTWRIDLEATLADDRQTLELGPEERARRLEQARKFMGEMTFEFTRAGLMIARVADTPKTEGTYTVIKSDGDTIVIEARRATGDREKVEQLTITFDGDRLRVTDRQQSMVLTRL